MRVAILGAGALGCFYGAKLEQDGHDVTFIARSAYDTIRRDGLKVQSVDGDIHVKGAKVCRTPEECGPVDLVVLCWKTFLNGNLAAALPPLLGPGTEVLSLQNGMGNAEAVSAFVAPEKVFVGLCFVCCMMDTPGVITHLEGGDIQFAPFAGGDAPAARAEELAAMFRSAGIRSTAFRELERIQWCKLTWNIPFNGLCLAHGGISVQQLFAMPGQVERARGIMEEVYAAAERRGFAPPKDIVDTQMERTAKMGPFVPSSAVDYQRGRQVEYDAIWGIPLQRAQDAGASVPLWEQLCREIRERLGMA